MGGNFKLLLIGGDIMVTFKLIQKCLFMILFFCLSCVQNSTFAFTGAFHLMFTSNLIDNILFWEKKYKELHLNQINNSDNLPIDSSSEQINADISEHNNNSVKKTNRNNENSDINQVNNCDMSADLSSDSKQISENQKKCNSFFYFLKNLTPEQKKYIISGSIGADVGRFYLDNFFPASDEMEFITKVKENAKTLEEKLFAFGMELHYLQDKAMTKFSYTVFNKKHTTTYSDYGLYDKWCIHDCKTKKVCTSSLNKQNLDFDFNIIYDSISKIFDKKTVSSIEKLYPIFIKNYYSDEDFFELNTCSDLLVRTYNSLNPKKELDKEKILSADYIKNSFDSIIVANIILSSLSSEELSEEKKKNAEKAHDEIQLDLIKILENYDLSFFQKGIASGND